MDSIIAIIFGIVQGLTEFIPVSSSGHLLILHEMFPGFHFSDDLAFDVAMHIGTLLALVVFFWKDGVKYVAAWISSFKAKKGQYTDDQRLSWNIIVAIIPAALAGFFFEDIIEEYFRSVSVVIVMLIAVALFFIMVEKSSPNTFKLSMGGITWKKSLFIGLMQVLSLVPGTSRSGITIISGMVAKLSRETAARFSFLISIPLVAGAGLKKTIDLAIVGVSPQEIPLLLLGAATAAIIGFLAIKFMLNFLQRKTLQSFAWYRIALGLALIVIFYVV
ncbi:MAG: undecaprenyl-diphosphatase UppP [Candidatus Kerfeldbacteria bacterium]